MPVAPSFQDLLDLGRAEAQGRRPDLAFFDGDITVAQLHGAAAMGDRVVGYAAECFRETFFHGARGAALTSLVADRTGIQRDDATRAQVTVTFTRAATGSSGTITAGTRVATAFDATGHQVVFTTDTDLLFGSSDAALSVSATAADAGVGGNVAAGAVSQIQGSLFATFTVTNAAAAGGGNAEESDPDLLARAVLFWETRQKGTLAALEFGALTVPAVRVAHAKEDAGTALVTVLVSDADGSSSLQMVSDVRAELENWRAAGCALQVVGGRQVLCDLGIYVARVRPGFSVAQAAPSIAALVTARINRLKTEQVLYLDSVIAAVIAVAPDDIYDVAFTSITVGGAPAAFDDVVPAAGATLRAGTITVTGAT